MRTRRTPFSRDDLFDQLQRGKLNISDAEAQTAARGLAPLREVPAPETFHPENETFWTLPMAVAWVAWRSLERVTEYWDEYRLKCADWHWKRWRVGPDGPVHEGWFLEQRQPATLIRLALAESYDRAEEIRSKGPMDVEDARVAVWDALSEGLLQATGIPQGGVQRVPIAPYEWNDLQGIEEGGRDVVRVRTAGRLPSGGYEHVVVPRKGVMALWTPQLEQPRIVLPEQMRPHGPGYMPLYCAAQWIATAGGACTFDPVDVSVWKPVYSELLARLASEEIKVVGVHDGLREPVPGYCFAACAVDYPFQDADFDLILSDELYLRSYPYVDEEHWLRGFDDALVDRRGYRWRRLMVLKSDVARLWPFTPEEPLRTGAPGRPTSMQLIKGEFERRISEGALERSISEQAEVLERWLSVTHPEAPRATKKTIENNIRSRFRSIKRPGN